MRASYVPLTAGNASFHGATDHFGDRSFSVSGPKIWNALPSILRLPDISYTSFKRGLKTVLLQSYFDC
jgi:hypothetical protein